MKDSTLDYLDASAASVIASLTESRNKIFDMLKDESISPEMKGKLLDHALGIDESLIKGISEVLPVSIYRNIKKQLKRQDKEIEDIKKVSR